MKAAIFVGGKGKRLGHLTTDRPKPLVEIAGRSMIDWQMDWLKANGVSTVVLLTGRHSEKMVEHAKEVSNWGVHVEFVQEVEGADTGGALKCAESNLKGEKSFYVTNGDTLSNLPLKKMRIGKYAATMALVNEPSPFGVIKTRGNQIIEFIEKPLLKNIWINAGFILATPAIFEHLPERGNLSDITCFKLASLGLMGGKKFTNVYWKDIGTQKDLEMAEDDIQNGRVRFG